MAEDKITIQTTGANIIAKFSIIIDLIHGPLLFFSEVVYRWIRVKNKCDESSCYFLKTTVPQKGSLTGAQQPKMTKTSFHPTSIC